MTYKQCEERIDYFIEEAKYLRCTVLTSEGPAFSMDTEITDERFEIFQKDILAFIKKIINDENYINLYTNIGPYEYCVGQVQKQLMKLRNTIELMEIIKIQ